MPCHKQKTPPAKAFKRPVRGEFRFAVSVDLRLQVVHPLVALDRLRGEGVVFPPAPQACTHGHTGGDEGLQLCVLDRENRVPSSTQNLVGQGKTQKCSTHNRAGFNFLVHMLPFLRVIHGFPML